MHGRTVAWTRRLAAAIDTFLSNERSLAESNESWFVLRGDALFQEGGSADVRLRTGARLVLPKTEERLHLVIGSDSEGTDGSSGNPLEEGDPMDEGTDNQDTEEESVTIALQAFLEHLSRRNLRAEIGASARDGGIDPYGGIRWRQSFAQDEVLFRITERLRWYAERGVESRSRLDIERAFGDQLFLRGTGRADWIEEESGWGYAAAVRAFHFVGHDQLLTYETTANWSVTPSALESIAARARYACRILRPWIRLELAPEVAWPRERDRHPTLGLRVRLEFLFGKQNTSLAQDG